MQTKYSNNLLEIAVLYYRLTPNKKTFRLNVFVNHIRIIFYIFKNELTLIDVFAKLYSMICLGFLFVGDDTTGRCASSRVQLTDSSLVLLCACI